MLTCKYKFDNVGTKACSHEKGDLFTMEIHELENQIELGLAKLRTQTLPVELKPIIPRGYSARVTLRSASERKKKSTAAAACWSPESGDTLLIHFEPDTGTNAERQINERKAIDALMRTADLSREEAETIVFDMSAKAKSTREGSPSAASAPAAESRPNAMARADPIRDIVLALNQAESRPDFKFVALKWFRDTVLLEGGFAWAQSDAERQKGLRDAIEKRMVLTGRMPNPRSPEFPVTSIRLNHLLPEVQSILRGAGQSGEDFEPASIRGEPLSATILRERR
jgi:hypothetical protein